MPRHDLDRVALVAGVTFAGLAVVSLLDEGAVLGVRWLFPLLLIAVGIVSLVASRSEPEN